MTIAAPAPGDYDRHRREAAARIARLSRAGRDIGPIPPVRDPERKRRALADFRLFCGAYLPATFHLPFCPDHGTVIERLQTAVTRGGLYALAMPRGSGKTSLCEAAVLWGGLGGRHEFVALIGSDKAHALDSLDAIKLELRTNAQLAADWPEVCFPIAALEAIAQRGQGQLCNGRPTFIAWRRDSITLPTIPDSPASGVTIRAAGLTAAIRGMKHKRPDGRSVRPSLVVVDDPQTDKSAASPTQVDTRERLLAGAILGLAGPGRKIAGIMPLTVIKPDDLADRILDHEKHPEWQGARFKLVYEWPTGAAALRHWEKYAEIRAVQLVAGRGLAAATAYYREHRKAMDAGARVAWPERKNRDELSALQHAVNLRLQDAAAFAAEYQNDPDDPNQSDDRLTPADVAAKTNGHKRRLIPRAATILNAHVDVHDKLLYWAVCAWEPNRTGYLIDRDTWPQQRSRHFAMRTATRTLGRAYPGQGKDGAIFAGLLELLVELAGREWQREDGQKQQLGRLLIDIGYKPKLVYAAARKLRLGVILPSRGLGITAQKKPLAEYKHYPGDAQGEGWRIPGARAVRQPIRTAQIDTNYLKTQLRNALADPLGQPGNFSLYEGDHRLTAEHLTAEVPKKVPGWGRIVEEWNLPPSRPDNHWLDNVVACLAAAIMAGARLIPEAIPAKRPKRRRKVSYL